MLATSSQAVLQALKDHRQVTALKIRTIERLPELKLEELLQRYAADAPALYMLPGTFRVQDDNLYITLTIAGVVRNVAGHEPALRGDGVDIGLDHLMLFALRAVHAHAIGPCTWLAVGGEVVDDPVFDATGVAAIEMRFESTAIPISEDWELGDLDNFTRFHADIDLPDHAGDIEYASWLKSPPDYTAAKPDLDLDVQLEGAS